MGSEQRVLGGDLSQFVRLRENLAIMASSTDAGKPLCGVVWRVEVRYAPRKNARMKAGKKKKGRKRPRVLVYVYIWDIDIDIDI